MASAQVLPNPGSSSRKQNLEAGKRKLEEFRKKKAEERAKKAGSTSQRQSTDASRSEKQSGDRDTVRFPDSNGASTSERDGVSNNEPPAAAMGGNAIVIDSPQTNDLGSFGGKHTSPASANMFHSDPPQKPAIVGESRWDGGSRLSESPYVSFDNIRDDSNQSHGSTGTLEPRYNATTDQSVVSDSAYVTGGIGKNNYQSSYYDRVSQSREDEISSKEYLRVPDTSRVINNSILSEKSASGPVKNEIGLDSISRSSSTSYADSIRSNTNIAESVAEVEQMHGGLEFNGASILDGRWKLRSPINHQQSSSDSVSRLQSKSHSMDLTLGYGSSSNHVPLYPTAPETGSRRSRPSFLDSLNVNRVTSSSYSSLTDSKSEPLFPNVVNNQAIPDSSPSQRSFTDTVIVEPLENFKTPNLPSTSDPPINPSVSEASKDELLWPSLKDASVEWKHEYPVVKHDENFAALEQHIEDLTQEKFSLQRALDASRALAESLAGENSSLTDSYNQQGAVVNQLKSDMERLQEEIRLQLIEIESIKMEYGNAQLEITAAEERAKILASEVIGLEEKALRLRSSELKLERQLENSNAEITSYKKKVSILEKERQDLQSTISALQEEKKLWQSKLWKASGGGKPVDTIKKTPSVKKDISTSTEDLGVEVSNFVSGEASSESTESGDSDTKMQDVASLLSNESSTLPENSQFHLLASSAAIPPDQQRMIGNINSLISELALEKEELMRALVSESSNSSNLKELNKELSRKLEAQTQRLELLTAQSMVNENIQTRQADTLTVNDNTPYTDEGDEVVERVLGWIMKLFPGGPSKRRTSKLL